MRPLIRLSAFVLFLVGLTIWGVRACTEPGPREAAATLPDVWESRLAR